LVSDPKSALSLANIPGDSLRIVARALDSAFHNSALLPPWSLALTWAARRKSMITVQWADLCRQRAVKRGRCVGMLPGIFKIGRERKAATASGLTA
jgi:hypothetical protein